MGAYNPSHLYSMIALCRWQVLFRAHLDLHYPYYHLRQLNKTVYALYLAALNLEVHFRVHTLQRRSGTPSSIVQVTGTLVGAIKDLLDIQYFPCRLLQLSTDCGWPAIYLAALTLEVLRANHFRVHTLQRSGNPSSLEQVTGTLVRAIKDLSVVHLPCPLLQLSTDCGWPTLCPASLNLEVLRGSHAAEEIRESDVPNCLPTFHPERFIVAPGLPEGFRVWVRSSGLPLTWWSWMFFLLIYEAHHAPYLILFIYFQNFHTTIQFWQHFGDVKLFIRFAGMWSSVLVLVKFLFIFFHVRNLRELITKFLVFF